jgi:hypothetical protein
MLAQLSVTTAMLDKGISWIQAPDGQGANGPFRASEQICHAGRPILSSS